MANVLRQRIPWGQQTVQESSPLLEEEVGLELEELSPEEGLTYAFDIVEGAESTAGFLEATGIGAPIGVAIGVLAAVGFAGYEIYEHFLKRGYNIDQTVVDHHLINQQENIQAHKNSLQELDLIPLEHQLDPNFDLVTLSDQQRGFVIPPWDYLGPGNGVNRGFGFDLVDRDARRHDYRYLVEKNVEEADKEFIKYASDHFIEGLQGKASISDSIGGALGTVGIGVKHIIEKATGQIYPSISGKICINLKMIIKAIEVDGLKKLLIEEVLPALMFLKK